MLIESKAAYNSQNKMGDSPLHLAAWGGHDKIVEYLLNQPDINTTIVNKDNKTARELAKTDTSAALLVKFGIVSANGLAESDEED